MTKPTKYAEALTWWRTGHLNEYTAQHKKTIQEALRLADALEQEPKKTDDQSSFSNRNLKYTDGWNDCLEYIKEARGDNEK